MEAQDEIIRALGEVAKAKQTIYLLNVYKGVPISYEATIVDVGAAGLRVTTQKYQIVCLYRERETYIQHRLLPYTVHARLLSIDVAKTEAVLAQFTYARSRIGDRMRVRVKPEVAMEGDVVTKELPQLSRCELADISQDGVALYIPTRTFSPQVYQKGAAITVTLRFPGAYTIMEYNAEAEPTSRRPDYSRYSREDLRPTPGPARSAYNEEWNEKHVNLPELKIRGTVANLREEPAYHRYRVGLRIHPDDFSRTVISQFIIQRQTEIIKELRAMYDLLEKNP